MVSFFFKIIWDIIFMQVKSLAYADFVDSRGELLLKDTREHTEARVYAKALWGVEMCTNTNETEQFKKNP